MERSRRRIGATRATAWLGAALLVLAPIAAQAEDEPADDQGWSGEVILAFASQTGTVDTIAGTLDANATRTWEKDSLGLRLLGAYGRARKLDSDADDKTADSQIFRANHQHRFTERFFFETRNETSREGIQDRDLRFALNAGPGIRVWQGEERTKEFFDLSTGVGYRHEITDGNRNDPGNNKSNDNLADFVAAFEYRNLLFDQKIEFSHTGGAALPANRPDAYILRTEVKLGVPLVASWSLNAGFFLEYTNDVPDKVNELLTRSTIGLGYKF